MYHLIIHEEILIGKVFFAFREFAKLFDKKSLCKHFHNFHRYGLPSTFDVYKIENCTQVLDVYLFNIINT